MANTTTTPAVANSRPIRHSSWIRCIAIIFLSLIVIVAVAVLIIWLAVKPKRPVYSIEEGSVQGFNIIFNSNSSSSGSRLNATFNFVLRGYNPNTKVSIYYDRIETRVSYDDQTLAENTVEPFFQAHRNVTRLGLAFVAQDRPLMGSVARDLRLEKSSGEVELEVRVKAKIRFKVGAWKSRHRTLKLLCAPLSVRFSSSKSFERTLCDVAF